MAGTRWHLHSMVVHSVVALVLLGALAYLLLATGMSAGRFVPDLWSAVLTGSLLLALVTALPSVTTGISDRNHMYATWHPSHRIKLLLSVTLVALLALELVALVGTSGPVSLLSATGVAVVIVNPALVVALAAYGLRITLGRQALIRLSYEPDMYRTPPVDILDTVAAAVAEEPKLIDPLEEAGS